MKVGVPGDCMVSGRGGYRFQLGVTTRKSEEVMLWRRIDGEMRPELEPVSVRGRLDYGSGRVVEVVSSDGCDIERMLFLPDTRVLSDRGCVLVADLGSDDRLLPRNTLVVKVTPLYVKARCIALPGVGARFCDVDGVFVMLGI